MPPLCCGAYTSLYKGGQPDGSACDWGAVDCITGRWRSCSSAPSRTGNRARTRPRARPVVLGDAGGAGRTWRRTRRDRGGARGRRQADPGEHARAAAASDDADDGARVRDLPHEEDLEAVRATAQRAAALGLDTELLRVTSPRPVTALLESARDARWDCWCSGQIARGSRGGASGPRRRRCGVTRGAWSGSPTLAGREAEGLVGAARGINHPD